MTSTQSPPPLEASERFSCFGGDCAVLVQGSGPAGTASEAAARARRRLLYWHDQFSRFDPASELSQLNRDLRATVPVSPLMARFVEAGIGVAALTGGLVDPTLIVELEDAGYGTHFASAGLPLVEALQRAPARRSAAPDPRARWRLISVDRGACTVTRPPGLRLDSGGIVKGLFGDLLASVFGAHASFAVDAAGDVRFGGAAGLVRRVEVTSPFDESVLRAFELVRGAAATSGIGKRSWLDREGRPAHHLLDPATGRPAFTGVVQVTALAPLALEAEALAKAALLSGRDHAAGWLPRGGVVVYDDGGVEVIEE